MHATSKSTSANPRIVDVMRGGSSAEPEKWEGFIDEYMKSGSVHGVYFLCTCKCLFLAGNQHFCHSFELKP